jgi:transposase-like protein
MKRKKTRQYTPEEKVSILRQHLLDRKPVSEICEEQELQPSVFYRWQKQFFEEGGAAFQNQNSEKTQMTKLKQKVEVLESKLQVKNEVLSELMEEHVQLKKKIGGY